MEGELQIDGVTAVIQSNLVLTENNEIMNRSTTRHILYFVKGAGRGAGRWGRGGADGLAHAMLMASAC